MAVMPTPPPPLSSRLGDVRSSPVRDILELTQRAEMISWARLPDGWDAEALLHSALEHDVAFVPGHPFFAREADPRTLRLSFTTHVPEEIAEGLGRLRRCWSTVA